MTHHRTVHVLSISHGQAIRKSRSEEYLPSSHKAEENLDLKRNSLTIKTIPSFSKLGKELKVQFISKGQREERKSTEELSRDQEKKNRRWKIGETDSQQTESTHKDLLGTTVDSEPRVKIKMSLVQTASPLKTVSDLKEARDTIKKLNDNLLNEKRLSEAKDTTIGNLRHEIDLLDQELVDKRKENDKYNEEMRKLRSKTTALETENKILERQVKMMNESNKRLHNELHELRNKLRIQETKVGELRVQRSEAVRKYAHLLQTSVDKGTRLRYFLQQLQNEILTHSVTSKKFHMQKQALEDLMQEDSEEDLQFKKYGLLSPRKMRKASYLLSEEEKESLRKDVESALVIRNNKGSEKSFSIEKLTTATERVVTEGLKSRLGRENEESSQISKLMEEAKYQIKGLDRIESSHVDASKRLEDKVGTQLKALEAELKDLSDELRLAQISKREDEEKLRSIRKFSAADTKVESIILGRRASQVEKLELESVINSMERNMNEDAASPMSPREVEILSMKQKMADMLEEKLMLSDELIESRTSLSNLESLLESRGLENEKMEQELKDKERRISVAEEHLKEAKTETTNLKEELEVTKDQLSSRKREEMTQPEGKAKDRPHRVELNFTPNSQPALEQKVGNLKEERFAMRRNSAPPEQRTEISATKGVDKAVQVGDEPKKLQRLQSRENPRRLRRSLSLDPTSGWGSSGLSLRRSMSLDPTGGHAKLERKVSKTEVKLVKRAEKAVQVEITETLTTAPENSRNYELTGETLTKENQELKAILEKQEQEIVSLENELEKLREEKKDSNRNGEDNMPFNYPKRVSELWTSLEEARKEKEEGDKRNKELQEELEKQQQEIHVIIRNLKQENPQFNLPFEVVDSSKANLLTENNNYFKENERIDSKQGRTLEELVSANETSNLNHEFVYDNEDGRRMPNELRLEVSKRNDDTVSILESVIDRMKKDLATSEQQSRELETELYRKEEDFRKAESEIELYKVKLSEMKASLEERNDDKDCTDKEVAQIKAQVVELSALLEETRKEKLKTEEKSEQYKSQISELRSSLDQRRKENVHVENNMEMYKSQISELKTSLDRTKKENEKSALEILQHNSQIQDLKNSLEDTRKEFHRAEKEIQVYKSEMLELKILLDETKVEKDKANEIIARSKLRIPELKALLDDANKELSFAKKEIELYQTENLTLKSHLENTEQENENALDEIKQYKSQISVLEASLDKTNKENISAREEIRKIKSEILDLKTSLDEKIRQNEQAIGEIERYKSRMEDLNGSLEYVKKENNRNLKEIDRYKQQISDLKISLGRSKKESANVTKEYELYKFEISDLQASLDEERKENRAAAKTIEKYKSEISDQKKSLDKAKEQNNAAALEVERFKNQISDFQASLDKEREENLAARNIFEENESEISVLNKSLQKAKEDNKAIITDNERCKSQIADLKASLEEERKENLVSAEKIEKYEYELFDLRNSFEKTKEETSSTASDIESYKTQISDLQAVLEDTKNERQRYLSENDELQKEMNKSEEKEQDNKMKQAEARLEIERLKTGNSKLQITIENLKAQLIETDRKVKYLENRAEEDNKTISQLMEEQLGVGRLQEQIKVLETKLSVRDKNLEEKVEEIIDRKTRIEQLKLEKDELQKKVEEISLKHGDESVYFDSIDGKAISKAVAAQSLCETPQVNDNNVENIVELGNEVVEFKEQLQSLQVALNEIQQEKCYLEDTVQQLQNVKISQEKELELLRQQVQILENGVQDTENTLAKNAQKMLEKEKELRELVNEKVVKTSQIESLEASLSVALRDRDSTLAGKLIH